MKSKPKKRNQVPKKSTLRKKQTTQLSPSTHKLDKRSLRNTLLAAAIKNGRKKKETWLKEITEFQDLIKEAYLLGASRKLILKGLHSHGFKIPHLIFSEYFNKAIETNSKKNKKMEASANPTSSREEKIETPVDESINFTKSQTTSSSNPSKEIQTSNGDRRKRKKGDFRVAGDEF